MYSGIMQKLFDACLGYPVALFAANEEFLRVRAQTRYRSDYATNSGCGWSAYEIWRSRIRIEPPQIARFLARR
jgi:hypothetical protein